MTAVLRPSAARPALPTPPPPRRVSAVRSALAGGAPLAGLPFSRPNILGAR